MNRIAVIIACAVTPLSLIAAIPPPTSKADAIRRATDGYDTSGTERVELPAGKTRTGPHDFYSLFAMLPGGGETVYGIGVASSNKLFYKDTRLAAQQLGEVKVTLRQQMPAPFFQKVDYIEATFTREGLERAAQAGANVKLTSSKGALQFAVPGWMFAALLEAADQKDHHRQAKSASELTGAKTESAATSDGAMEKSPYIRDESIGTAPQSTSVDKTDPFVALPVEAWVGEKFIFAPMWEGPGQRGYTVRKTLTSDISYIPYARYRGKIITVKEVRSDPKYSFAHIILFEVDDTKERLMTTDFVGHVEGWVLKRDIDYARANFIGKTLWLRNRIVQTYDAQTKKMTSFKVKNLQPVQVTDVVLNNEISSPLRFILKDDQGKEFIKFAQLSGTNVRSVWADMHKFRNEFFTADPRKTYSWDERTFHAIEDGEIFVGMTKEQTRISWGDPLEVNRTISGNASHEQWVYGGSQYVYFDGDRLTSLQD